ncbi:hypothetical protein CPS_0960 [Colwellia psychrerythraea 34H]|uniref:Uncharacterized protein n=1 Tax=Colwellia psychrerythraea (strain 34H / ATCC BAA-681) TaxID=167879 RepID=Q487Q6_COLP3|nr:hypothetical protein CPS_0960 [Colwellia psychrerythraea 34H]
MPDSHKARVSFFCDVFSIHYLPLLLIILVAVFVTAFVLIFCGLAAICLNIGFRIFINILIKTTQSEAIPSANRSFVPR